MARTIEITAEDTVIDLSAPAVAKAVQELVEAQEILRTAEKRVAVLKTWLKDAAFAATGGTVGVVAGIPVVSNRKTATFARAKFAKERPDLAEQYTVQVIKDELDTRALKTDHPELFEKYRSSMLLIDDEGLALAAKRLIEEATVTVR